MSVPADHGTHVTQPVEGAAEIAIAGGGLVGTTLAVALGTAGIPVVLIEARRADKPGDSPFDTRPIALSQSSRRILDTLGLWERLCPDVTPITRIHVSDRGHFGFARLRAEDHEVDALGYVIGAARLGDALEAALGALEPVRVLRPAVVDAAACDGRPGMRLSIADSGDGRESSRHASVEAKLLVLCDGGRSPLRGQLGIAVNERDYGQWAVTARVEARCAHHGVAYERFTASGPLALLPMQGASCGLVWSLDAPSSERLVALGDDAFLRELGEQFGMRLGGFGCAGPRSRFPVRLITASQVVGERLAIIGNAANHLHPVAGQGFNLGLRDVAALAEIVSAALREGGDPGDAAVLERYAAGRRADQKRVARATDALVRLFSNRFAPLVAARGLGLLAFDLIPPIKRRFGHYAMGLAGRQSRLARGLAL